MEGKFYTIDQVAEILGMHHKTIRKFISEGKLSACKIGKQWRITEQDLDAFMRLNNDSVILQEAKDQINEEFTGTKQDTEVKHKRIQVSAVVDIENINKNEYIRISNTLIAIANSKTPGVSKPSIQLKYDERERRLKVILWGDVKFIEIMLSTITVLTEQDMQRVNKSYQTEFSDKQIL